MKKIFMCWLLIGLSHIAFAQNQWFSRYTDSAKMVGDASEIVNQFSEQVKRLVPSFSIQVKVVENTSPYLIFNKDNSINLTLWRKVIPPQKAFFATMAGSEKEGEEVFGLFFNGFYLAHEMGHIVYNISGKNYSNAYASEYDANVLSILYWRKAGKNKELENCYRYAKKMLSTLKNPVPKEEDYKAYITANYNKLAADPYQYGYIQFSQFVEIYEDKALPDFDTFIKKELLKR